MLVGGGPGLGRSKDEQFPLFAESVGAHSYLAKTVGAGLDGLGVTGDDCQERGQDGGGKSGHHSGLVGRLIYWGCWVTDDVFAMRGQVGWKTSNFTYPTSSR